MRTRPQVLMELLANYYPDEEPLTIVELRDFLADLDSHDPLRSAAIQLHNAINDYGAQPRYHRTVMIRTQHDWPSLWRACQRILQLL